MHPDSLASLQKLCDQHERFLVISHVRPDGDAYGSTLGLALSLRALGKDVQVVNADGLSPLFEFLPGSKSLTATLPARARAGPPHHRRRLRRPEAARRRLRPMAAHCPTSTSITTSAIPATRTLNLIDAESPATAQVLYEIIAALKWPLTAEVAANLYVGIMTDTGNFRYRQTTARTFEVAAKLVAAGADPTDLAEACYQSFRAERLLLIARGLQGHPLRQPEPRRLVLASRRKCTRAAARSPTKPKA